MTLSIFSTFRGAEAASDDGTLLQPRFVPGAGELPLGVERLRPDALSQLNPYRPPPHLRSVYERQPALRSSDERDWVRGWTEADAAQGRGLAERDASDVTPSGSADNLVDVGITQPQSCAPLNITFDPSKGKPPYTVHIAFSEWYPYIFSVPASYSDPTLGLWLVQFMVPMFQQAGVQGPTNPNMIVSVSDSTGAMTNSSVIAQVNSPSAGVTCAGISGSLDFIFWSDPSQTQCLPFSITWAREGTQKGWTPPLGLFFLPEQTPPLYLPIANATAGGLNWTMIIPAGKRFLMTMSDAGPLGGGVSGLNTVGGSEYANQNCIDNATEQHSLPRPTTTVTGSMPDFTASVASLTTENGIVVTQTVVQTVRNGKALKGDDPTSAVIGASVGAGLAVGIAAAFIAWFCWRRRQKKRTNLSWDLPDNVAGQLNQTNAPMDKKLLQRKGAGATIFASAGRLNNLYPTGNAPDRSSHANSIRGSFRSLASSAYDQRYESGDATSPQTSEAPAYHTTYASSPPSGPQRPYSDFSPTHSDGNWPLSRPAAAVAGAADGQEVLIGEDSPPSATPSSRGFQGSRRESASSGSVRQSGTAYRSPFSPTATYPHDAASHGAGYEEVPMSEPMYHSSSMSYHGHSSGSSYAMTRQASAGSSGNSPITSMAAPSQTRPAAAGSSTLPSVPQGFVQHSDAGLLLDDTMDEEENQRRGNGMIELPPQYDAVPPRAPQHGRSSTSGSNPPSGPSSGSGTYQSTSSRGGARGSGSGTNGSQQQLLGRSPLSQRLPEGDISTANQPFAADLLDEGVDEDEFWRAS
ncbi:hypothetical protein CBOM_03907 [Ceraceosorus bombacis]|uniref:Uncharacterized protein n=1 Tax=Ceraceosorus bombacis TaxID=401625 RepID=A0A0P1BMF3_9BASI|nr:hypothetical protein CBOM_03907 [Ceraceosorus bombacis]